MRWISPHSLPMSPISASFSSWMLPMWPLIAASCATVTPPQASQRTFIPWLCNSMRHAQFRKCFLSLLSSMYVTKPRSALGWASGPCLARTGLHHDVARTPCVNTVRRITWKPPCLNSLSSCQTQQKYRHTHEVPRCSATWHTPMHHDASMQSNR